MQDRFKFRCFGKSNAPKLIQGMHDIKSIEIGEKGYYSISFETNWISFIEKNQLELMQCTGLKDKNGKLIYEGDIVDCYVSTKKVYRYQVKYEIGSFMLVSPYEEIFNFKNKWNDNVYPLSQLYFEYENEDGCIWHCEVIGNIYEHPELLEDK